MKRPAAWAGALACLACAAALTLHKASQRLDFKVLPGALAAGTGPGMAGPVLGLAYGQDGRLLCLDETGGAWRLRAWDSQGALVAGLQRPIKGDEDPARARALASYAGRIYAGRADGRVEIFGADLRPLGSFDTGVGPMRCLAAGPQGVAALGSSWAAFFDAEGRPGGAQLAARDLNWLDWAPDGGLAVLEIKGERTSFRLLDFPSLRPRASFRLHRQAEERQVFALDGQGRVWFNDYESGRGLEAYSLEGRYFGRARESGGLRHDIHSFVAASEGEVALAYPGGVLRLQPPGVMKAGWTDRQADAGMALLLLGAAVLVWVALGSVAGPATGRPLHGAWGVALFFAGAFVGGAWHALVPALLLAGAGSWLLMPGLKDMPAAVKPAPGRPLLFLLLCAALVFLVVEGAGLFIRLFGDPAARGDVMWMFPSREHGSGEIPGGPLGGYRLLGPPLAALAAAAALLGAGLAFWPGRRWPLLAAVVAAAMGMKFAVASLSPAGVDILWIKGQAPHSSYLRVALDSAGMGAWEWLRQFNRLQFDLPVHAATHGPLPELFYRALLALGGVKAAVLSYMALISLGSLAFFGLGREAGGEQAGLAAALLFASSPMNLILGNAGFDAALAVMLAACLWAWMAGLRTQDARLAALCGAIWWLAQMASLSTLFWGLPLALLAARRPFRQWRAGAALALGLPAALHLGLWAATAGDFSILACWKGNYQRYAQDLLVFHQDRPHFYWIWGNFLVYAAYAGLAGMAAWLAQAARLPSYRAPAFAWAALFSLGALFFCVAGTAEVPRDYLWAMALLLPAAAPFFTGSGRFLLAPAAALNAACALAIEMRVLDQN